MGRIGVYGGTFNPPHNGHTSVVKQALELLNLDKVLVLPASIPPHKALPANSPTSAQRLELVTLAMASIPQAQVLDLEIQRPGASYTVDTLQILRKQYPGDQLYLIMGTDMFLSFHTWYQASRICQDATLAVVMRDQKDNEILEQIQSQQERVEKELGGKTILLHNEVYKLSSTDIRRMATLDALDGLLPDRVCDKIQELALYGAGKNLRNLTLEELEAAVVALLDPKRVNHVLGCRDTAVALAQRYGVCTEDAARAGLLHDVTKALTPELHLAFCRAHQVPEEIYKDDSRSTFHATTGAIAANIIFGESQAVCDAIACHTTGKSQMSKLDMILYIADYIEPNRKFEDVDMLRELAWRDLELATLTGIQMTLKQLRRQGRRITGNSQGAVTWLQSVLENRTY